MTTETASGSRASERIERIRRRYQQEVPRISIQRARYFTEKWRELGENGTPPGVRVALSMKNVYENMGIHVDADDRIAGTWSEFFLGSPVDIERGLYNGVLETELNRRSMIAYQARVYPRFFAYLIRKSGLLGLYRNLKFNNSLGPMPVSMGIKTLQKRKINAFEIDPADKKVLLRDLLPYWKGRCMADLVDRELRSAGYLGGDMAEFVDSVPNTPSRQAIIVSVGASIATYQGHLILDHEKVMRLGLLAVKKEIAQKVAETGNGAQQERDFLKSMEIAVDGVIVYAKRLADRIERERDAQTDPDTKAALDQMLTVCRKVPLHPAESFREAVQSFWTLRIAVELANPTNVHSIGRLDQIFHPYYENDVREGVITREQTRELLEELLLKIMTQSIRMESNFLGNFYLRYEGSTPVTLGGLTPGGEDATNDLTRLFLEATDRAKTVTSVVLRVHRDTPEDLYRLFADILYKGTSNLSMMNDEIFVEAMKRRGFSEEDSRDYAITGCTDLICPGKTGGISYSGLLLSRTLDLALRNGDARTLLGPLSDIGPRTGDPNSFASFDELLDAFIAQADYMIKLNTDASNLRDRLFAEHMPAPYVSAFIQGCLENKKDVTRGGGIYDYSGINMINSVANVVDSLYVIRRLVFEQKRLTFKELMEATDCNFAGHEHVLRMIREVDGKWGNGNPDSDALAREVARRLFEATDKYRSFKDGPIVPSINSMTSHTIDGRLASATPDGRRAATPYASSCNPYNVENAGVTGVLRSVAAVDFTPILGCAVNVRLHPSAIGKTNASRDKWSSLIRTYFQMGGAQIQPTVASAEMLRAAQRDPDGHRDLIVKVGGYSTYFVELGREIQDEIISRTQHENVS